MNQQHNPNAGRGGQGMQKQGGGQMGGNMPQPSMQNPGQINPQQMNMQQQQPNAPQQAQMSHQVIILPQIDVSQL